MAQEQVYIEDLKQHVGREVTVKGWVYHLRSAGKKLHFLVLRDGSGYLQAVVSSADVTEEIFARAKEASQESSVTVCGLVKEDARSPGGVELQVKDVTILQRAEEYPISNKEHGTAFLMEHRHLWLRSSRQVAILKVRAEIEQAIHDYFYAKHFVRVDSPILTPAACEGTTTLFETDYFGDKAYLSQSGQLYQEPACMALGRTYCFGPTFRAEKSKTRRHLMEFWMVEPEAAFYKLEDVMDLAEDFLVSIVGRVLDRMKEELKVLERDTSKLESVQKAFPRISYTDAVTKVQEAGGKLQWGSDLGGDDETILANQYDRPVMVHRYPAAVKAFYMEKDPDNKDLALGVDVLAPEGYGEIIGGGERMADPEKLLKAIHDHGLPEEAFKWYLEIRRYGGVPHGGFGLGIERTVSWICGLTHVRETIPFARMLYKIYP